MRLGFSDSPVYLGPVGTRSTSGVHPAESRAVQQRGLPADQAKAPGETGRGPEYCEPSRLPAGGDSGSRPEAGSAKNAPVIKRLSFVFYGEAGDALVRVYDARTGELLREIPPQLTGVKGDPGGPREPGSPARQ